MILKRLKRLWKLSEPMSEVPDNVAFGGFGEDWQPMTVEEAKRKAKIIPRSKRDPIKEITGEE